MIKYINQKLFVLTSILFIIQTSIGQAFDGFALYNKQNNNTAYLIDKDGLIAHTWSCNVGCCYTVLLKENGNI